MVVQNNERNIGDQRNIEFEIFRQSGIKVIRLTLKEIFSNCKLDDDKELL
jgi:hypothetical protein